MSRLSAPALACSEDTTSGAKPLSALASDYEGSAPIQMHEFCAQSSLSRHRMHSFVRDVECFVKSHMTVRQFGSYRQGGAGQTSKVQHWRCCWKSSQMQGIRNIFVVTTEKYSKTVFPKPCKQKVGEHQGRMARSGSQAPSDPFFEK